MPPPSPPPPSPPLLLLLPLLRYCLLNCEKYLVSRLDPTVFVGALKDLFGLHDKEAEEEKTIVGRIPTISSKALDSPLFSVDDYVNEFLRPD